MTVSIFITNFAKRHWDPKFNGTKFPAGPFGTRQFPYADSSMAVMQEDLDRYHTGSAACYGIQRAGYAPFCKHLFVPNVYGCRCPVVRITGDNCDRQRVGYKTRAEGELPYLARWLSGVELPRAEWLDVVLYTGRHLREVEGDTVDVMGNPFQDTDWGVVNFMGVMEPKETPMPPETIIRNALGPEFGGSGVPIDRAAYLRSVDFWTDHAMAG